MNYDKLTDMEKMVLNSIKTSKYKVDAIGKYITLDVLENEFGEKRMLEVSKAISSLTKKDFIEEIDGEEDVYRLTPNGKLHLPKHSNDSLTINYLSHNTNSNIANHSQNVQQSIKVSEQKQGIQVKISEFETAAKQGNGAAMKKAFGYIADKAVDVAIAIALGQLIK